MLDCGSDLGRLDRWQRNRIGLEWQRLRLGLERHLQHLIDPLDRMDVETILDVVGDLRRGPSRSLPESTRS